MLCVRVPVLSDEPRAQDFAMLGPTQRGQMLAQEGLLTQIVKACSRMYDRVHKWNEMTPGECAPMFQAASLLIRRCATPPFNHKPYS